MTRLRSALASRLSRFATVGWKKASARLGRWRTPGPRRAFILLHQGVLRPMRPDKVLRIARAYRRWGATPAFPYAAGAIRHPDRPAVIDERGALSFAEIDLRTTRLGHGLRERGVRTDSRVGILCANHHSAVETMLACSKIGTDVVLLNTTSTPERLARSIAEQHIDLLVADEELTGQVPELAPEVDIILAWTEGTTRRVTLEQLIGNSRKKRLPRCPRRNDINVLAAETADTDTVSLRQSPPAATTLLSRIPLRSGERTLLCAPLFHFWGLTAFQLAAVLGATLVLRRECDPQHALTTVGRHQCTSMFALPRTLRRLLEFSGEDRSLYDLRSLRVVACVDGALGRHLSTGFQRAFGPVLYTVYAPGAALTASIATPRELVRAPGTAGRAPSGTSFRVLDDEGKQVRPGEVGRIFVRGDTLVDDIDAKQAPNGVSTGDVGRCDRAGRLFVIGRETDRITSGGEDVYPREIEGVLASLPEIHEVSVLGVDDPSLGQRLAAFVVRDSKRQIDEHTVRDRIRKKWAKFTVPTEVVFLDELPRDSTGMVLPMVLRQLLENQ